MDLKIHEQIYHQASNAHNFPKGTRRYSQFYYCDADEDRMQVRSFKDNCNRNLLRVLDREIRKVNFYAKSKDATRRQRRSQTHQSCWSSAHTNGF